MTVIDEKRATGAGAHPTPLWAPGGPDGPGGTDGKSSDWLRRPRRRRVLAVAAVAVIAAGAGGGIAYATARGSATLTTAQVTATTDPAVVDVVSVLSYEHGTSAGTGIVLTATGEVLTNNHVVEGPAGLMAELGRTTVAVTAFASGSLPLPAA